MKFYVTLAILSSLYAFMTTAPITEQGDLEDTGEYGEYFEGDMLLTAAQRDAIKAATAADNEGRNGLVDVTKRWPNGTVVYHIQEDDFDEDQMAMIENALADIANKSCIKFRKRENEEEHAVTIQGTKNGCFSNVGLSTRDDDDNEGEVHQVLNLAKGCFRHGTVVHEMLHTLGFYHMQSTYDRDDFVTIVWENILAGTEHNFAKYNNDTVTDFGVPYDYSSVMHYTEKAFSKNGNKTIIPIQGSDDGCYSTVGYNKPDEDVKARQVLNLGERCFNPGTGTIIHECLHTLGFFHMQSNYNRDDFVTIIWENIRAGKEHNFVKFDNDTVTDFGVPYDYGSVLHYSSKAFSKNGNKTIIPVQEGVHIGQRLGLSERDIIKLNKMYCEDPESEKVTEATESD